MLRFRGKKQPKAPKKKSIEQQFEKGDYQQLHRAQRTIYRQALLAGLTVILTVITLFAVTSAWYTNIVQTGNLVFEAESWGFDGKITVGDAKIVGGPGDEGAVHLEVENNTDSVSAISVNVSKGLLKEEMRKRLFFYVDTRMNRGGEIMDRVYINNFESYTYTLFSKGKLTLTEDTNNAPQLKWQWVYDVLGYYVMAERQEFTPIATTPSETNGGSSAAAAAESTEPKTQVRIIEKDYLRPIEYDYDQATTRVTNDGQKVNIELMTVDGEMTPFSYLVQQTAKDGYPGVLSADTEPVDGYYPIDVDKNGYGVYARLCTPAEIEVATAYDTKLGELAYVLSNGGALTVEQQKELKALDDLKYNITLSISAQKNESTATNVNSVGGLQKAINQGIADVVQLSSDIHIQSGESLVIPQNTRTMIDLNQHTITYTGTTGKAVDVQPGSSLTMVNGNLVCENETNTSYGVYSVGGEVVMSQVAVNGFNYGVYIGDSNNGNDLDSRVHMVGCTADGRVCAIFISGNGLKSEQKTQLVIEQCELYSDGITISGNGSDGRWGTDIQIVDSKVLGYFVDTAGNQTGKLGSGIYQPQRESTLTVQNSTVEGYVGIALKAGTADIIGSTVTGLGEKQAPAADNSGFTDTGDAIYIDATYEHEILLKVRNFYEGDVLKRVSEVTSSHSKPLQIHPANAGNVAVKLSGGKFDEMQPENYIEKGYTQAPLTAPELYEIKKIGENATEG